MNVGSYVQKAPLNEPIVVGTGEGWYVLEVLRRVEQFNDADDVRDLVRPVLKRRLALLELVKFLREDYKVEVDTALFRNQMRSEGLLVQDL